MRRVLILALCFFSIAPVSVMHAAQTAPPTLTVQEPASGATINGNTVTVKVQTTNFSVIPSNIALSEYGQRPDVNKVGEGHIHLTLDLLPLIVWDKGDSYTFSNVPPGEHQLKVELANNDHSSLYTPVLQTIRFSTAVAGQPAAPAPTASADAAPTLAVLEPKDGATIAGSTLTIKVQTGNFTITPSNIALSEYGQRPDVNKAGEGHVHMMLDLLPLIVSDKGDTYTFTNVPPGDHQLKVELANNDHSSLYTPVLQTIRFRTTAVPASQLPRTAESSRSLDGLALLLVCAAGLIASGAAVRVYRKGAAVPAQRSKQRDHDAT